MPRVPRTLPLELRGDVAPVARFVELGLGAERARRADIDRPFRGVVAEGFPLDGVVSRAVALSARRGMPDYGFSHVTGAAIRQLPLPLAVDHRLVHVTVRHPDRSPRLTGVSGHAYRLPPEAIARWPIILPSTAEQRFVPVLTEPWLFATLATVLSLDDLIVVADALRTRAAEGSRSIDISEALAEGRRGSARAARAWALSVTGARSRPETLMRIALMRAGLPSPTVGYSVVEPGWRATPDLAWPEYRVLVEYEGDHHRTDPRQFAHDLRRFERYHDSGWVAVRATRLDLFEELNEFTHRMEKRLRERGWRPNRHWQLRPLRPIHR